MIPQSHERRKRGHEPKDVDSLGVALVAVLVLFIVGISFLVVRGLLRFSERDHVVAAAPAKFPEPRLEVQPAAEPAAGRAKGAAELHSYGWIDRNAGVVHIPIERAMALLLERGLPEVGGGQTRLQLLQARPQTNSEPTPAETPQP